MKCHNPFAFRPGPVTFWAVLVYAAFLVPLLWVHESVPPAPSSATPLDGVNLTEAWYDLTTITRHYHPYNSHDNERVGNYILERIEEILDRNDVEWTKERSGGYKWATKSSEDLEVGIEESSVVADRRSSGPAVTVFDDDISNVTWASKSSILSFGTAGYFEGTNKLVYIRGSQDEDGEWWKSGNSDVRLIGRGGVLVNAHYDSVSSGYGATDDGMGVVSLLQMLNYFTTPGHQPKRGVVLVFNNAEEDGLLGAKAFAYSPLFSFPTTFVNLEGAGAGGRAILFRSSDKEVTKAYSHAPDPFGSVIASDGFKRGLVASQTDYVIWNGVYGQRGLDIAFYRPRARYHTNQDDTRHASSDSLWHMLSNSLPAVNSLSDNDGKTFTAPRPDGDRRKVPSGKASDGVWFDVFGKGFALLGLRGLFAWALTLLIVSPLILMLVTYILVRKGKYYLFSGKLNVHGQGSEDPVYIRGYRGLFRFPFALIVAAALTFAAALLIRKVNPLIIYSSEYAVFGMELSLFYIAFWTIMKGSSAVRPSALQRAYAHIWLFIISWILLVGVAVFTDRFRIAAFFPFAFLHSSIFLATLISLLDLFALLPKQEFAQRVHDEHQERDRIGVEETPASDSLISPAPGEVEHPGSAADDEEEPTETTPLRGSEARSENSRTTFGATYRRSIAAIGGGDKTSDEGRHQPFEKEQTWSGRLPSWTWFFQFLIIAPINIIILGQVALLLSSATHTVRGDGTNDLVPYFGIAAFSVLTLLPLAPFIHRVTFYIPTILLAVFVGTLVYNLIAFPFSANNRYKVYFQQDIDFDEGKSAVKIMGIEEHVRDIIGELPSSAGQSVTCSEGSRGAGLADCSYDGSAVLPNLVDDAAGNASAGDGSGLKKYGGLVSLNASRVDAGSSKARFTVHGKDTKVCTLSFDKPLSTFSVKDGNDIDSLFGKYPDEGVGAVKLFRRDSSRPWVVDVEWIEAASAESETVSGQWATDGYRDDVEDEEGEDGVEAAWADDRGSELRKRGTLSGRVECQWNDANMPGTIPAFDEALQFAPDWAAFTKRSDGLVRVFKSFTT